MKPIVKLDKDGHLVYEGMLSSKEIASIDEILNALKQEIPQIEEALEKEYGKSVLYKYYLGKFLGQLLTRYGITANDRRKFWDEIKTFATKEIRTRDEGSNAETRSFFGQCYRLSQFDKSIVEKLSWHHWQSILDRVAIHEDDRLFSWIGSKDVKFSGKEWREFEKGLNKYLKNKDTSVFSDEELFAIYDSIYAMGQYWVKAINQFSKEHPKSAKVESQSKMRRSKKYQGECFRLKKELHKPLDESIFSQAFELALK